MTLTATSLVRWEPSWRWGWMALLVLMAACGGGQDDTRSGSAEPVTRQALANSMTQPSSARPNADMVAAQKEGARLNSEELAGMARTGWGGAAKSAASRTPVYRFYNTRTGAHFYTLSEAERAHVLATLPFMTPEGPAFHASTVTTAGLSPVYRFYNTRTGVHFYTISASERSSILATLGHFTDEGIAYYASTAAGHGLTPLYRFYVASRGFHFYTASLAERDRIQATLSGTYSYEGVGYHVMDGTWVGESLPNTAVNSGQCFETGSNILANCAAANAVSLSTQQDGRRFYYNTEFFNPVGAFPLTDCVRSDLSGLVWEGKTSTGLRAGSNSYTHVGGGAAGDASGHVNAVNASNLCGFSDWRLPTPQELQNLVRYGVVGPIGINLSSLPNTSDTAGGYWSNAPAPLAGAHHWSVSYGTGARTSAASTSLRHVRLVRGPAFTGLRFAFGSAPYPGDAPNNLVVDQQTGLQWRRCVETKTWNGTTCVNGPAGTTFRHANAFSQANSVPGWRVPNVKELSSLLDPSKGSAPLIDTVAFPNTPAGVSWSTTPAVNSPVASDVAAFSVDFGAGLVWPYSRAFLHNVRLVHLPN